MPKVVVALLNAEQEFQQLQAKDARESGARLKLDVEVVFAEGHAVVQIQQLFKHIHAPEGERPAAIVVEAATGEGLERVARNAVRRRGSAGSLVNAQVRLRRRAAAGAPGPADRDARRRPARGRAHPGPAVPGARPRRAATCCACRGRRTRRRPPSRFEGLKEALGAGFEVRGLNGDWTEASGEKAVVVLAAPQDGRGVPARRRRLPERLDGRGRAQGAARAPPGLGGRALPRLRRAARGRPEAGGGGRPRGDGRHALEHRPGARDRRAVAADEAGAAPRGAAGPAVAPAGGPDPAARRPLMARLGGDERPPGLPEAPRRDGRGFRRRARAPRRSRRSGRRRSGRPPRARASRSRRRRRRRSRPVARKPAAPPVRVAQGAWPSPEPGARDRPRARPLDLAALRAHPRQHLRPLPARGRGARARWPRREAGSRPTAATGSSSTAAACSGAPRRATRARTRPTRSTSRAGWCPGPNVIGVEVLFYGHGEGTWPFGKPGFLFALRVEEPGGRVREVVSDGSWRALLDRAHRPGQFKRWYLRALQEDFDARLRPAGWSEPGGAPGRGLDGGRRCWRSPADRPAAAGSHYDYLTDGGIDPDTAELRAREVPLVRETFRPDRPPRALRRRPLAPRPARLVRVPDARLLRDRGPDRRRRPRGRARGGSSRPRARAPSRRSSCRSRWSGSRS